MVNRKPATLKLKWQRHRAQAKFRREPYQLTFDQWLEAWQQSGHIHKMGRRLGDYTLIRVDTEQPWHRDNIKVISRGRHHIRRQTQYSKAIEYSYIKD